jgi:hypothetical protein
MALGALDERVVAIVADGLRDVHARLGRGELRVMVIGRIRILSVIATPLACLAGGLPASI